MSYTYTDKIKFAYTPNFDAFNRLRVSEPFTLFDSSHRYSDNGLWETSGSGTASFNETQGLIDLEVNGNSDTEIIRETTRVFAYQPGKSLLVLNTFTFETAKPELRQRVGYFGVESGCYLQLSGSNISFVERSSVSGITTNTEVSQSLWNVDKMDGQGPSGVELDFTKVQILWQDFEWLGAGSVRCGFVVDGQLYTSHIFHHANNINQTYINTACLPIRYEIKNLGATGTTSKLKQICSSVISEGGYQLRGVRQTTKARIDLPYTISSANTYYPVASIRLRSSKKDAIAVPRELTIAAKEAANYGYWIVTGGTTTGGSWVSSSLNSVVEYNLTATSFQTGSIIQTGFFTQTNQGGGSTINLTGDDVFRYQLTRNSLTGSFQEFTIAVAADAITGGGNTIWASIGWEEIVR
jgi:hypothetical protein